MNGTQAGFFDSLIMTVRDNPIAAALIGGGAFWLLVGDERLKSAARSATAAASPAVDMGARNLRGSASEFQRIAAPPTAPEMNHDRSFGLGEMVRDGGAAASDAISAAGDKVRDRFDEGVAYARENFGKLGDPPSGKEALMKARSSLADVFERQPLVLGPIGLAIGAAVASAFRTSELENEWMGELSDDVKADLNTRAGAVSDSLGETSNTLIAELTDSAAEAVDLLKEVGMDAANAAREKAQSS
jgi:hypothetical protein